MSTTIVLKNKSYIPNWVMYKKADLNDSLNQKTDFFKISNPFNLNLTPISHSNNIIFIRK